MKRIAELHATVAEWIDEDTGKKCKRTIVAGALYVSEHGKQVIKMEALPTTRNWSGWLAVRPIAPALPPGRRQPPGMPPAPPAED
jgi:hypothetical protein